HSVRKSRERGGPSMPDWGSKTAHSPHQLAARPERSRRARAGRCLALCAALPLAACQQGILDPRGPIAAAERLLLINSTPILLVVVMPVIAATLAFAWWFRSPTERARRSPDESYEGRVEFVVWSIPALIVILVGGVAWISAHELDPRVPIPANAKPLA